jgi:hypothetical protein
VLEGFEVESPAPRLISLVDQIGDQERAQQRLLVIDSRWRREREKQEKQHDELHEMHV